MSSQRGMTVFLAGVQERSSKDGMSYGSHVENESQKIIMKCFGSCQLFRGLWVDLSSEFADIHMRIDAKNLVNDSINHSRT